MIGRLLLATGAIAVVALAGCRKSAQPPVATFGSAGDTAEQVIWDGHTVLTTEGIRRGELFADTMFVFHDQTLIVLRRVRATFNTELGVPNGTLRGDRGIYDLRTRVLDGYGNVVVTSTKGEKLTSPHLRYTEATNLISSDSAFTLVQNDRIQRGIGFTSDPNLNRFRCLRACGGEAIVPLQGLDRP